MKVKEVIAILEELAPLPYAEDFDNVGLLVGDPSTDVSGILVTLDTLENVVDEAITHKCNLIVSFHPILFKGLKSLTGTTYVERVVIKAIQNKIAIYSMHTALDNSKNGVNAKICEMLGLQNTKILLPQKDTIKKLVTYVPLSDTEALRDKLFEVGAGSIGNYSNCSFTSEGIGSYKANAGARPVKGTLGEMHYEKEAQLHITYPKANENQIMSALFEHHPYEEVAYEISTLENRNQDIGMGMIGELEKPMDELQCLGFIKQKMQADCLRHSRLRDRPVRKIAVLGGSGAFAIAAAKAAGADIFVTADVKYHQFYEAEGKLIIADIGHYETEQFTKNLLVDHLTKKIPNFAIRLSDSKTNPIKYL